MVAEVLKRKAAAIHSTRTPIFEQAEKFIIMVTGSRQEHCGNWMLTGHRQNPHGHTFRESGISLMREDRWLQAGLMLTETGIL